MCAYNYKTAKDINYYLNNSLNYKPLEFKIENVDKIIEIEDERYNKDLEEYIEFEVSKLNKENVFLTEENETRFKNELKSKYLQASDIVCKEIFDLVKGKETEHNLKEVF